MNRSAIPANPRSLARLVLIVLVVFCIVQALRIVRIAVDGVGVDYEPIDYVPQDVRAPASPQSVSGLFGQAEIPDYGFDSPLPATPLALTLRGVVTGERGYAIIVDDRGDEGVFRIDDELPGGVRVVAIEPRRVVLERGGAREALELPGGLGSRVADRSSALAAAAETPLIRRGLGIASLSSMTDAFRLDPETLSRQITILPLVGGGFRVSAGRNATLFQALGFQRNDVVLAINGQPVNDQGDVRALFERLRPEDGLAITVRRGDRQRVLTPNLDSIAGAVRP